MMKKIFLIVLALFLPALSSGAQDAVPGETSDRGKPVVSVNGVLIREKDVLDQVSRTSAVVFHKNVSPETLARLSKDATEGLIENELIYQDAKGKVTVADADMEKELDKLKKRFGGEEKFNEELKKTGASLSVLKSELKRMLTIRAMLELKVVKPSAYSEEEAKAYYESNRDKYMEPEKMKLREIYIMVPSNATAAEKEEKRKKAVEVLEKIRAGGDFGLLAWDYSEDQYKFKSGELGYIHQGMLSPEVEKEVVKLKEKETTGIIDTIYGFYIFYLEGKEKAKQLDFSQVKDKLIKDNSSSREKKAKEQYLSELRSKAVIKRL